MGIGKKININGKKVEIRGYIPAKHGWKLLRFLPKLAELPTGEMPEYDEVVVMLTALVAEWQFEGDPSKPESYENLDLFKELFPLFEGVADALGDLMASRKN